jgi:hypothetical protein
VALVGKETSARNKKEFKLCPFLIAAADSAKLFLSAVGDSVKFFFTDVAYSA